MKQAPIDVSSITNDQFLFQEIQREYSRVRQEHEWNLAMLFPKQVQIPSWILRLLSMAPPRHLKLPCWLASHLEDCRIFIPTRVEFVQVRNIPWSPGWSWEI